MSDKSHHSKGKRTSRSKKSKAKQRAMTMVAHQIATPTPEAAAPVASQAPSAAVARTTVKPSAIRYAHVAAELRKIGILAGIMIIILVVLALVLS